jgi:hypothetical protein
VTDAPRRLRGEERDEQIRAGMAPLHDGERPRAVAAAATVCVVLAAANLIAMAARATVHGHRASVPATLVFCAVVLALAAGLWRVRYWAIVLFQALLAFAIVFFSLFLLLASNLLAAAVCITVIGLGGWLFWSLIRPMARVQLRDRARLPPERGVE